MLWDDWWKLVGELRPACARTRTFLWMALCLAGMTVRKDLMGVRRRKIIKVAKSRRDAYADGAWRLLRDFGRGWPRYGRCWTSELAG